MEKICGPQASAFLINFLGVFKEKWNEKNWVERN